MKRYVFLLLQIIGGICFLACEQHHKNKREQAVGINQLSTANSPYLQQHANNPVAWYEWGDEALKKAEKENKIILVSIGYAACHWCHVMEKETFSDTAVAAFMNKNFVNIKVDREERPDIDQIYSTASMLINGNSGWPLNAFALPDGRPFHAGTYYTKEQWMQTLTAMLKVYQTDLPQVKAQAEKVTHGIQGHYQLEEPTDKASFEQGDYVEATAAVLAKVDLQQGGIQGSPKFPMPSVWELLMQAAYLTDNQEAELAVTNTLNHMIEGGIYDQLGGGFARYSVDERWQVPHFEKMLYDNAQLLSTYAQAYKMTKNQNYARVMEQSIAFLKRELRDDTGLFWSSIDADSEGEEGKFYTWQFNEIHTMLKEEEAKFAKFYYQLSEHGNWEEGKNILTGRQSLMATAKALGISEEKTHQLQQQAQKKLWEYRQKRQAPATDKKIITAWNSLMVSGLAEAFLATGKEDYLTQAQKTMAQLEQQLIREGQLYRSLYRGSLGPVGFADDYAYMVQAYVDLYAATLEKAYLDKGLAWMEKSLQLFAQEAKPLLAYAPKNQSQPVVRTLETEDGVLPSSNAVFASVLYDLGEYYQREELKQRAEQMFLAAQSLMNEQTFLYFSTWLQLGGKIAYQPFEVAVMGKQAVAVNQQLQAHFLPTCIFMGGTEENLPLLKYKASATTKIYVCKNRSCQLPVTSVEASLQQLKN